MRYLQTATFTVTILLSAFLLFLVQPMFAKMILPLLGGTASVWTTCMLAFQAMLLIGYIYAHIITKYIEFPLQVAIHLTLLLLACLQLPLGTLSLQESPSNPILWILGFAISSIGLPFLMISSTAPLLQRWFSLTGHVNRHNPYFLYAASNLGSMIALLGYPFGIEAYIGLKTQQDIWGQGFFLLVALLTIISAITWRALDIPLEKTTEKTKNPDIWQKRLLWLTLSAIPSSLMLGVTTFVSTDIAAISLFWVVPLALYLLTFILVFGIGRNVSLKLIGYLLLVVVFAGLIINLILGALPLAAGILLHVAAFFLTTWFFHGQLAKTKPAPEQLTEFYLWMSIGGMLGGCFNAIVAPIIFKSVIEYYLIAIFCLYFVYKSLKNKDDAIQIRSFLHVLLFIFVGTWSIDTFIGSEISIMRDRSFYGAVRVSENKKDNKSVFHILTHGTTLHGVQQFYPESEQKNALSYYYAEGLFGNIMNGYAHREKQPATLAMIGLGAGAMSVYAKADDQLDFYEIDPAVISIAENPKYFTYLSRTPAKKQMFLGDARIMLQHAKDHTYDVIVVDAFSSDSIPVNLLTQEAINLYLKKAKDTGVIALHISNRYLELKKVIANYSLPHGYSSYCGFQKLAKGLEHYKFPHEMCFIAKNDVIPLEISNNTAWQPTVFDKNFTPWTDDFSNIFSIMYWSNKRSETRYIPPKKSGDEN